MTKRRLRHILSHGRRLPPSLPTISAGARITTEVGLSRRTLPFDFIFSGKQSVFITSLGFALLFFDMIRLLPLVHKSNPVSYIALHFPSKSTLKYTSLRSGCLPCLPSATDASKMCLGEPRRGRACKARSAPGHGPIELPCGHHGIFELLFQWQVDVACTQPLTNIFF